MKKAIGIVIGVILVLGMAFGVREVIANQAAQHPRTEKAAKMDSGSQPKATSSSQVSHPTKAKKSQRQRFPNKASITSQKGQSIKHCRLVN